VPNDDQLYDAAHRIHDIIPSHYGDWDHFAWSDIYRAQLAAACEQYLAVYHRPGHDWPDDVRTEHTRLHRNTDGDCNLAASTGARCAGCAAALDKFHRDHGCDRPT
jgi:hypothetical protein